MRDIASPGDVRLLVSFFYASVRKDVVLGPIFDDIARVDWEHHLPTMVTFWESLLLRSDRYRRNALKPHLLLFKKIEFHPEQMVRWLELFDQAVNRHFYGKTASKAKHWARDIAHNLQKQITSNTSSVKC